MSVLYAPFCYILTTFFISPTMIGLIVAITLAVGVIAWLMDLGNSGFPVKTFMVVAIGTGMLLGIPTMMNGMGIGFQCPTPISTAAAPAVP